MTAHRWSDDVGSVADEAGRLLESLRRAGADAAARPAGPGEERTTDGAAPEEAAGASGEGFTCDDPVCQWCPLCRASAFVRRLSPETLTGLAELAGFAATVLADLASARAGEERGDAPAPEDGRD